MGLYDHHAKFEVLSEDNPVSLENQSLTNWEKKV